MPMTDVLIYMEGLWSPTNRRDEVMLVARVEVAQFIFPIELRGCIVVVVGGGVL